MPSRRAILVSGAAALAALGAGAYLYTRDDPGTATYYAQDGIALRGADPVAYFTEARSVIGSAEFAHDWAGVTWHFANAAHRDAFVDEPERYAPQYGGYCAWAVAAKQELYSIQPANWTVLDGKLYLNFSDGVQEMWDEDREGFIKAADDAWPMLSKELS